MVGNPALDYLTELVIPDQNDWIASMREPEEEKKPFDPSVTDILGYSGMSFVKEEAKQSEVYIGLDTILKQSFPRWVVRVSNWLDPPKMEGAMENIEQKDVDILDARKDTTTTFAENGFTLLDVSDAPSLSTVQNWRSQEDIKAFQKDLEPKLLALFPGASRVEYTYSVVRGGTMFGDQPAAIDGPHLDYSQNDEARETFYDEHPISPYQYEVPILLEKNDSETEEFKVLLGLWKPVMMETPVCDHPLAVMDAKTFRKEHEGLNMVHMNFGAVIHILGGSIRHQEDQKWYYYPFQKESEVLVFTQYSKGKHFANPHSSFRNPNCPEDSQTRVSVEMRAAIYFPKQ